jgi:hypothetical protein
MRYRQDRSQGRGKRRNSPKVHCEAVSCIQCSLLHTLNVSIQPPAQEMLPSTTSVMRAAAQRVRTSGILTSDAIG